MSSEPCKNDGDPLNLQEEKSQKKKRRSSAFTSVIYITAPFIIVNDNLGNTK